MPVALTESPPLVGPPRKPRTRVECEALASSGVLDYRKFELIEGELINRMGEKRPHVNSVTRLSDWLRIVFGAVFVLQESPIDVLPEDNPTNEPEPDLIVLNRDRSY